MPCLITLEGEITLHNLEKYYEQLLSASQDPGGVTIICAGLTYLDTAAFQLLVALKKSLDHRPLTFQEVPSAILDSADLLGVTPFLKLRG
jgi:anti-anti-sigma regulatory factor